MSATPESEELRKELERELWIFRGWTNKNYAVENLQSQVDSILGLVASYIEAEVLRGRIDELHVLGRADPVSLHAYIITRQRELQLSASDLKHMLEGK